MKFLAYVMVILGAIATVCPAFAQEKAEQKEQTRTVKKEAQPSEKFELIYRIAKGKKIESQDSKNFRFTLKPTKAFITIMF